MTSTSMPKLRITLHPYGCECAPGTLACSFISVLQGTLQGRPVTFTLCSDPRRGHLMLIADGSLEDREFRSESLFTTAVACNPNFVHEVSSANYTISVDGRASVAANSELPEGDVLIVTIGGSRYS